MRKYASRVSGHVLALVALLAPTARAHIELIDPPARYQLQGGSDNGIKSCPCGLGGSNRVCNVAADGSDPDRSERVSRFEAGSTITLRFEEFINHAGRFRVAFDPDGADMADFNANILTDLPDPPNASGMLWEIPVTLPAVTCERCTLQLVQAMEVDQNTPIADPAPISSYYSCVDIELVAPGTLDGDSEEPGESEPVNPGMGGEGGAAGDDTMDEVDPGTMPGPEVGGDAPGAQPASGVPTMPAAAATSPAGAMPPASTVAPVAMNAATGAAPTGALPGVGVPESLPAPGDVNGESSSAGSCSLPAGTQGNAALGLGVFGLFALLGLRRSRGRQG